MDTPFTCWRCGEYGHPAAECKPQPAATRHELEERISRLVERWQEFDITLEQKRNWIADEMRLYEKARKT